jgi:sarcosine oxidase
MKVAIVGAGIAGLSTAWALTKRGHAVTIFEQGDIPNPLSASGDEHRMIRRAYGSSDGYTRLMSEAFDAWDAMWADLRGSHLAPTGILTISQKPGDYGDIFRNGLDRTGFRYDLFGPAETMARYPFLDASAIRYAFLSPEGGVLFCRRIAHALRTWLAAQGVALRPHARVDSIDVETGVVSGADGQTSEFDRVVVTAGAWVLRLFPDLRDRLTTFRTAVAYLEPPADLREPWENAPAILDIGGSADGYVIPPVDGTGLKVGAGVHKRAAGPDEDREPLPGEGERLRDLFSPPLLRIGEYRVAKLVTCAYTFTADETFFAVERGRALVVSACSGHGYKFGAAVGRRTAEAVETGDFSRYLRWLRAEPGIPAHRSGSARRTGQDLETASS